MTGASTAPATGRRWTWRDWAVTAGAAEAIAALRARGFPFVCVTNTSLVSRRTLAGYKLPKSLEVRAELPRSPAGKVLKRLLRDEFWEGRSIRV